MIEQKVNDINFIATTCGCGTGCGCGRRINSV